MALLEISFQSTIKVKGAILCVCVGNLASGVTFCVPHLFYETLSPKQQPIDGRENQSNASVKGLGVFLARLFASIQIHVRLLCLYIEDKKRQMAFSCIY